MDIRTKLAELTSAAKSQTDLDAIVTRAGGLGQLFRSEFPDADVSEFMHEWDIVKNSISRM